MLGLQLEISKGLLDERGQRAGFFLLAALLVSFLFIRTSARLMRSPKVPWWPGSVKTKGGVHLHHLVFGIVLILFAGFVEFALSPASPWLEVLAIAFGVGAGLTLDEFALWVHLEDVYWAEEGRSSIDAVVVATLIGALIVLGLAPFDRANGASSVAALMIAVVIDVTLCTLVILKGRPLLALVGLFIWVVSLVGAVRLAAPQSPWARRRYAPDGAKMARSRARYERLHSRRRRALEAIGGAPSTPP